MRVIPDKVNYLRSKRIAHLNREREQPPVELNYV